MLEIWDLEVLRLAHYLIWTNIQNSFNPFLLCLFVDNLLKGTALHITRKKLLCHSLLYKSNNPTRVRVVKGVMV